jgi:hypothetical protein
MPLRKDPFIIREPRKIGILPPTCGYEKAAMEAAGRRKD